MKIENVPIYILLMFTAVYMVFADKSAIWSGLYFVSNYSILIILFLGQRDKWVRILGASMSLSILIFSALKFFLSLDENMLSYVNYLIFIAIAFALYKLETK